MTTTNATFRKELTEPIGAIVSNTMHSPFWVQSVQVLALANDFDSSGVTAEFLEGEIELRKSRMALDSHNWSDFARLREEAMIDFCRIVLARKAEAMAK